jgi:hypothetical protein
LKGVGERWLAELGSSSAESAARGKTVRASGLQMKAGEGLIFLKIRSLKEFFGQHTKQS